MVIRKPFELPPAIAKAFVKDMKAFFAEEDATKRDATAAHQLSVLREYQPPREEKLRPSDVKDMFFEIKKIAGLWPIRSC
jgi:hypothetical protein